MSADENPLRWELDLISDKAEPARSSGRLERLLAKTASTGIESWLEFAYELIEIELDANEAYARAYCCLAVEVTDANRQARLARAERLLSRVREAWDRFEGILRGLERHEIELAARNRSPTILPRLRQALDASALRPRQDDPELVALEMKTLDGWATVYRAARARIETVHASAGERTHEVRLNALSERRTDRDEMVRRGAHEAELRAWSGQADLCALALRGIATTRRYRFSRVGRDAVDWTLVDNCVPRPVMEAMFEALPTPRSALLRYFDAKARCLGKPRLDWWDLRVAVGTGDLDVDRTWQSACADVVNALRAAGHGMSRFAVNAFERRWVDAGMRSGKQPGGFCANFGRMRQSRVFLSFSPSLEGRVVLAHELGHAFHNHILHSSPTGERQVPPILLEAAALLAEHLMVTHLLDGGSERARLYLLDQQIQVGWRMLMDAPSRFGFERTIYEDEDVTANIEALSREFERHQAAAFENALGAYFPLLWASSPLFYQPDKLFQNWHYTLGYLFSQALVSRFGDQLAGFDMICFLRESGRVPPLELAREYLGAELGDVGFWEAACSPLLRRIDEFVDRASVITDI